MLKIIYDVNLEVCHLYLDKEEIVFNINDIYKRLLDGDQEILFLLNSYFSTLDKIEERKWFEHIKHESRLNIISII